MLIIQIKLKGVMFAGKWPKYDGIETLGIDSEV
jgi:hypothetical protein